MAEKVAKVGHADDALPERTEKTLMPQEKTVLIVSGVARSGTTALAKLLNSHDRICIGIERFKFQYLRERNFSADLFCKDRFFDFQEEDTNLRPEVRPAWSAIYDQIRHKWDEACIIGDKVPDMVPVLPEFIAANPHHKYIYILRNLKDVGLSWQARAQRKTDSWPKRRGFAAACPHWAEQNLALQDYMRENEMHGRMLLLDYDRMYTEVETTERAILGFLGLPPCARMTETLTRDAEFFAARKPTSIPRSQIENYKSVDKTPFQALKRLSVKQITHFAKAGPDGAHRAAA